jgi:hypothetical protein
LRNLASFTIASVIKKLNPIHIHINSKYSHPFPKPRTFWLSAYAYHRRYLKIHPDGRIVGGLSRFASSLIDFSFIRSIVAPRYSPTGFAYDPASLFVLDLFRYLEKYPDMKTFVQVLRDRDKAKHYRLYAGINYPHLPCEGTFSNLRNRLGEELYNQIFHVLVEIAELLGFLSYKIIATDGTLFSTNARFKGCTYFSPACEFIELKGIIENVRRRILYRLANPEKLVLGKEIRIKVDCPLPHFPDMVPRPKVQVLTLSLEEANSEKPSIMNQIFELKEELRKAVLHIVLKRGVLTKIVIGDSTHTDSFFFRSPKLPSDTDARIGVRRNPQNPNKKKIFGFDVIIDTSVELTLGIELPVACSTIAGNTEEGNYYITNREQILAYHGTSSKIDLADAKYDEHRNYAFSRSHGAIPIIDCNPLNEDLTPAALRERGYDQNGWPSAPCGILTSPNGFDFSYQRASFSCRRQGVLAKDPTIVAYARGCLCWMNYHGLAC